MKTRINIVVLLVFMIFFPFVYGCNDKSNFATKSDLDKLNHEIDRLHAVTEIQNLMGKYVMLDTSGMNFKAATELFTSKDPESCIEMMWGRYTGKDAAYRCFVIDHRSNDQSAIKALRLEAPPVEKGDSISTDSPPCFTHLLTTPVIEVAGDGQTARATWIMPSVEGENRAVGKFGCEFKIEDGIWKIWKLHVYGLFWATYNGNWMEAEYQPPMTEPSKNADKAPTTHFRYYKGAKYIPLEPAPPEPYETFGVNMVPDTYGPLD